MSCLICLAFGAGILFAVVMFVVLCFVGVVCSGARCYCALVRYVVLGAGVGVVSCVFVHVCVVRRSWVLSLSRTERPKLPVAVH